MADRKISDLTALTTPASGDYLPIVDISEASAANKNKRITIEELLRGAPDGTAAAPGIAFESDPDSGLYSTGANAVAISTGGTQRINIEADGDINIDSGGVFYDATNNRLAVGTTSPANTLHVAGIARIANSAGGELILEDSDEADGNRPFQRIASDSGSLVFLNANRSGTGTTGSAERARIDSSGRLLVGTSSTSQVGTLLLQGRGSATGSAIARLCTTDATPANGASIGIVAFGDSGHTTAAQISVVRDGGTWTSGTSQPTRLVFSTTADGASSPTERMRITSAGVLQIADAGDITVGTTTGTKIGTATTQKLGFWNATPAVQPAAVADATDAASVITQLNDLLAKLRTLGIIAT